MGDNIVLRFQYSGKDTDVVVDDIDKISLIDLILDYWERSEKENTPFPKNPVFSYIFKLKQVDVYTDQHLMQMFKDFDGRDMIYIWVGESKKATAVVESATKLRELLKCSQPSEPTVNTEPIQPIENTEPPIQSQISQSHPKTPKASIHDVNTDIHISPSYINDIISNNIDYWNEIEVTPIEPIRGRGRGRGRLRGSGRGRGRGRHGSLVVVGSDQKQNLRRSPSNHHNAKQLQTEQTIEIVPHNVCFEVGESSKIPQTSPLFKKKMAKTTAKRKGLWKPKANVAMNLNDTLENIHTMDLNIDFEGLDSDSNENMSDNDGIMTEDDLEDNDGGGNCDNEEKYDGEDDNEMVMPPYIYDEFDPYEGVTWNDDCEDMEKYLQRLYKNGEYYQEKEFGNIELKPWQLFTDKQHLREVLRDFCIQSGFAVVVDTANNRKYTVQCNDERCLWRLHAAVLPDNITWAIKSIKNPKHTCMGIQTNNPMVTANWASKALLEDIRANEDIPGKALNELLWNRYRVQMSKSTLYRAKRLALQEIHGGHDVSYSFLPAYCEVVRSTNPGSVAVCKWFPENHPERPLTFNRLFISFKGAIDGFLAGCRGLVGVDGTFLKGNYGGVLLSAVALDGNNEMFPIAWAIVSGEDEETWKFFINHLKNILQQGGRDDSNLCIISDRHKVIT